MISITIWFQYINPRNFIDRKKIRNCYLPKGNKGILCFLSKPKLAIWSLDRFFAADRFLSCITSQIAKTICRRVPSGIKTAFIYWLRLLGHWENTWNIFALMCSPLMNPRSSTQLDWLFYIPLAVMSFISNFGRCRNTHGIASSYCSILSLGRRMELDLPLVHKQDVYTPHLDYGRFH